MYPRALLAQTILLLGLIDDVGQVHHGLVFLTLLTDHCWLGSFPQEVAGTTPSAPIIDRCAASLHPS